LVNVPGSNMAARLAGSVSCSRLAAARAAPAHAARARCAHRGCRLPPLPRLPASNASLRCAPCLGMTSSWRHLPPGSGSLGFCLLLLPWLLAAATSWLPLATYLLYLPAYWLPVGHPCWLQASPPSAACPTSMAHLSPLASVLACLLPSCPAIILRGRHFFARQRCFYLSPCLLYKLSNNSVLCLTSVRHVNNVWLSRRERALLQLYIYSAV